MENTNKIPGAMLYLSSMMDLQRHAIQGQQEILDQVASQMVETIRKGKRIFIFGTGHSHMMAEEGFYRAGGLAAVVPLLITDLMLHENPDLGSRLERTPGLAAILLDQYQVQPEEMFFTYSNSGVNHLPVEITHLARTRGLVTVAVCSRAYAQIAPLSAIGKRLDQVAEYVIDNQGVPGDALVPVEGADWRVGPSSTVVGALIWNALITETIFRLQTLKEELPVFVSFNMGQAAEHNRDLLRKWGAVNPYLKGWIRND